MGAICPLGVDRHQTFAAALDGNCAIRAAAPEIAKWLPHVVVAPAAANPEQLLDSKYAALDRATQFALLAAHEAMSEAGISSKPEDAHRFGVYAGVGFGGAQTVDSLYERFYTLLHDSSQPGRNPKSFKCVINQFNLFVKNTNGCETWVPISESNNARKAIAPMASSAPHVAASSVAVKYTYFALRRLP